MRLKSKFYISVVRPTILYDLVLGGLQGNRTEYECCRNENA
jgi:hypothetical protein